MRNVRFLGQAARVFPRLPLPAQVRASEKLRAIAGWTDEHVPSTLSVADGTRLRYFAVTGYVFTYAAPRHHQDAVWVLKIVRRLR